MSITTGDHTRSVLSVLTVCAALAVAVAACGGSSKSTTTPPVAPTENTAKALGTTGLAGLDWGANADAVLAVYPRATPTEGGLWFVGMAEGHQAVTKFTLGANGLDNVNTEWTEGFVSMQDCAKTWHELRASLDGRLGPSQGDNLAAYWKTTTASITLACSPNDSNAGVLSLTYSHLGSE